MSTRSVHKNISINKRTGTLRYRYLIVSDNEQPAEITAGGGAPRRRLPVAEVGKGKCASNPAVVKIHSLKDNQGITSKKCISFYVVFETHNRGGIPKNLK